MENKEIDNVEIYDKNNGLYYTKVSDYYYSNSERSFHQRLPAEPSVLTALDL